MLNIHRDTNKWINRVLQTIIIGYLFWQLSSVGWVEVIQHMPSNPAFYLLQVGIYLALPVSELFIYKKPWNFTFKQSIPVFIYKKIFNSDVITYSGEVYLYYWAKNKLQLPSKQIMQVIRDNNILSTISSTLIAILLIGVFLTFGHISINEVIGVEGTFWLPWIMLSLFIVGLLAYKYREKWFAMSRNQALYITYVHTSRLLLVHALEMLQWIIAIVAVPFTHWFTLMAAKIATSRIPLLPNKDLLFTSIVIGLSGTFGIPQAQLASMLLVSAVFNKVLNLVFVTILNTIPELKPVDSSLLLESEQALEVIPTTTTDKRSLIPDP